MKKKITRILGVGLTLVMVLSFSIAMSLPVFAGDNEWTSPAKPKQAGEDGDWFYSPEIGALGPIARAIDGSLYVYAGIGSAATLSDSGATAEWSTEQAHSGSSSAELTADGNNWAKVTLTPPTGITLDDLADITSGWSWWYYVETLGTKATSLELYFDDPTDATDYAEITVMNKAYGTGAHGGPPTVGAWTEQTIVSTTTTGIVWYVAGAAAAAQYPIATAGEGTMAAIVEEMNTVTANAAGDWVLTSVRPTLGWIGAGTTHAYVDDISIDGVTYDLEGEDGTDDPGVALQSYLMKSTDDGRTWDDTDYHKDVDGATTIVDMVMSPVDADVIYVVDVAHVYITDDGGDEWELVSEASLLAAFTAQGGTQFITSVDVGYDRNDDPFVFIGTEDTTPAYNGNVFYVAQVGYPAEWTPLDVVEATGVNSSLNVYAVAASPEFDITREIFALMTDAGITAIINNLNGSLGDWDIVGADLDNPGGVAFESTAASRIQFPDDFDTDDAYEMFVGVVGEGATDGGVHRVTDADSYNLGDDATGDADIAVDIVSLDLIGSYGTTTLIAGTEAGVVDDKALISLDDGDSWDDPDKEPSGAGDAYVILDDDFDDNGVAWAVVDGAEGAVSLTIDSGALYNQISLIATDIDVVESISFSRKYATDDTMFMVTSDDAGTDSIWRQASDWERVGVSTLAEFDGGEINQVQLSPGFPTDETVYVALRGANPVIYRSTDAGGDWKEITRQPADMYGWVVVDEETIIVGGDGMVYWTDNHGRRIWEDDTLTGAGLICTFSLSPNLAADDTVLAGADTGEVWISEDLGEDWDQVEDETIGAAAPAYVAFDPEYADNNTIFAAAGDVIARCIIDTAEDWADQEWKEFDVPTTETTATVGADSFSIEFVVGLTCTINETAGAVLVTQHEGSPDILYDAVNSIWMVTAGAAGEEVLVEAIGSAEPCSGVITNNSGNDISWVEYADADDDAVVPETATTIADGATANFVLPDTEETDVTTTVAGITDASGLRAMPNGTLYASDDTTDIGVWRTINSTESTIGDTVFELVDEELAGTDASLGPLYITEGSNVLWALDSFNTDEVWTYTDFLVEEVELDSPWSNTGIDDTEEVMLKWLELEGADLYELKYSTDSSFDTKVTTVPDIEDEWYLVEDLDGGETYYWKVRVQAGEPLRSEWSRVWNFTMKLSKPAEPEYAIPGPGAQEVILSPSFYWPSVSNANNYEIEVATDTLFESLVASAEVSINSWVCDTTLAYSTGYYWRVRALKDDLVLSGWRVASFTTMPKAAAVTPPVTITPAPPAPEITITVPPTPTPVTPMWVWAIIGIGGALVIAVIVLIVRTRRAL